MVYAKPRSCWLSHMLMLATFLPLAQAGEAEPSGIAAEWVCSPEGRAGATSRYRDTVEGPSEWTELQRLIVEYGPASAWAVQPSRNPTELRDALECLEFELRNAAIKAHMQARAVDGPVDKEPMLDRAELAYAAYVERFPEAPHLLTMRYQYGELLYGRGKYGAAYTEYSAVVDQDPKGPNSQFCADSAMFVASKLAPPVGDPLFPAIGTSERPMSEWEAKQVAAADAYVRHYPNGERYYQAALIGAAVVARSGNLGDAMRRYRLLFDDFPVTPVPVAEAAATEILHILEAKNDWRALRKQAIAFRDERAWLTPEFRARMRKVVRLATEQIAQAE